MCPVRPFLKSVFSFLLPISPVSFLSPSTCRNSKSRIPQQNGLQACSSPPSSILFTFFFSSVSLPFTPSLFSSSREILSFLFLIQRLRQSLVQAAYLHLWALFAFLLKSNLRTPPFLRPPRLKILSSHKATDDSFLKTSSFPFFTPIPFFSSSGTFPLPRRFVDICLQIFTEL